MSTRGRGTAVQRGAQGMPRVQSQSPAVDNPPLSLSRWAAALRMDGRGVLRCGLGVLWLLDGLLQLQPGMFAMDMLGPTMQPTATGEPGWLTALVAWSIRHVSAHLAAVDWTVAALELAAGVLLLSGRRRAVATGAVISGVLALALWLFAESLGQLLSGSATLLDGAPGAMLLMAVGAGLVLAPDGWWRARGLSAPTAVVVAVLIGGAVLQLQPVFWKPLGLAQPFGNAAMMPQPHWLRAAAGGGAALALRAGPPFNAALVATFIALAVALALRRHHRDTLCLALAVLLAWWIVAQDMGMLPSGMATDPNSAPVLALFLWSGRAAGRRATRG